MNIEELAPHLISLPYPSELAHVDRGILGHGFYPAAKGFHNGDSPVGGIMLLGRDWGTQVQYDGWSGNPIRHETATTWRNTRDIYLNLLDGIPVWCTNYLQGVRVGGGALGNIRDLIAPPAWSEFERSCWLFLQRQVLLQRPRLIVVFGTANRDDLQIPYRLGDDAGEFSKHTFSLESTQHTAIVTYAAHPHSLIALATRREAHTQVNRIREVYEEATQTSDQHDVGMQI